MPSSIHIWWYKFTFPPTYYNDNEHFQQNKSCTLYRNQNKKKRNQMVNQDIDKSANPKCMAHSHSPTTIVWLISLSPTHQPPHSTSDFDICLFFVELSPFVLINPSVIISINMIMGAYYDINHLSAITHNEGYIHDQVGFESIYDCDMIIEVYT